MIPSDEQIQALLAFRGISLTDADRREILEVARYILGQAALLAGPLPPELEPGPPSLYSDAPSRNIP